MSRQQAENILFKVRVVALSDSQVALNALTIARTRQTIKDMLARRKALRRVKETVGR